MLNIRFYDFISYKCDFFNTKPKHYNVTVEMIEWFWLQTWWPYGSGKGLQIRTFLPVKIILRNS